MIIKSVRLLLAPPAAFDLFTQETSTWWPPDHRHTRDPKSRIFMLPGGRFFESAHDGLEVELGWSRTWDAPRRIVLDFFVATGREHPTEVEIHFTAKAGGAQVTVTHRPGPASEALWAERAARYARCWDVVLAALACAAR